MWVDRFMSTPMFYPCNYGFVNQTLSLDGDPVDVFSTHSISVSGRFRDSAGRPVGVLHMTDESGEDAKVIAVPVSKLTKEYELTFKILTHVHMKLLKEKSTFNIQRTLPN